MNAYETVKFNNDSVEIDVTVSPLEDTVWLSQEQMALLFNVNVPAVNKHIKNIISENELDVGSTVSKMEIVRYEGNRRVKRNINIYNLDMIISVGYKVNSVEGIKFRRWANKVLKEYLLKGYIINEERSLVTNENYVRLINKVESLDERVSNIEKEYKPKEFKNSQLFFDGEFYDAYTLIQSLFESANKEIIIIDNYIDRTILDRLVVKNCNVQVIIYTSINSRLLAKDINAFNNQYGGLDVRYTTNVHDRYIIIDQNKLYHLGHSIKDLGKKIFSISELDNNLILTLLRKISNWRILLHAYSLLKFYFLYMVNKFKDISWGVTRYNNELTLIKVKLNNGNTKSLKEILNNKDKYNTSCNFKLVDTNIGITNGIHTIPIYMSFLIQ